MAAPERGPGKTEMPGREELIEALRVSLARISDGKLATADIQPSRHVFDYGYVDSLSAVMFLAQIEESYGIRIDDVDLVERYNTLEAIADCIRQGA
jgi:acyl carrier protein